MDVPQIQLYVVIVMTQFMMIDDYDGIMESHHTDIKCECWNGCVLLMLKRFGLKL